MIIHPNSDYYPLDSSPNKLGGESLNISVEQKGGGNQDTESKDELVFTDGRSSLDVLSHDEDILGEEEELSRLLVQEKRRRNGTLASIKRNFFFLIPIGLNWPKVEKKRNGKTKGEETNEE